VRRVRGRCAGVQRVRRVLRERRDARRVLMVRVRRVRRVRRVWEAPEPAGLEIHPEHFKYAKLNPHLVALLAINGRWHRLIHLGTENSLPQGLHGRSAVRRRPRPDRADDEQHRDSEGAPNHL
jgi:hypothetical protein